MGEYNDERGAAVASGERAGAITQPQPGPAPAGAPPKYLWLTGRLVPWHEATVHITMIGWPAISAVFEGIRAYWNAERRTLNLFRLDDHLRRFAQSMKLMRLRPGLTLEQIRAGVLELLRANEVHEDSYCQPLAFTGGQVWGSRAAADQVPEILITTRPSPSSLLSGRVGTAGVSSWTRISDNVLPPRIKAMPNYANARLASYEAQRHGYDVPIFLNTTGKVSESTGSCLFMVRDGVAVTPPITASILESITRATVIELLRGIGVPVQEREVDRTELYIADEVFFCGTAMEIHPVVRVDGYEIGGGTVGPLVARLERLYHDVVRGIDQRYERWLTRV
ncbi:MAG: branched-chain amino acid transaminase [Chloroflexota bacterium]